MATTDDRYPDVQSYLANHPRMIGALFTIVLLLSQAGSAVADGMVNGP